MKPPPARVALAANSVRNKILRFTQRIVPPEAALLEMMTAGWNAQVIYTSAELGIPDVLAGGPKTAAEVAAAIGANPDATHRLLRHLVTVNVFKVSSDGRYALAPIGETLRTDKPASMRDWTLWLGTRKHREHWDELPYSVLSGKTGVEKVRGKSLFEYCDDDPELGRIFNGAMTSLSGLVNEAVLAAYDFSGLPTIADIGGGQGSFLADIVSRTPGARGILFDLPNVVAVNVLAERGVADRCTAVGGSFFESVPAADGYVLRVVIHDWSEEDAVAILRKVRAAINPGGRLMLVELVLPDDPSVPHPGTLIDIEMLVTTGGRERTRAGYAELFTKAGFELTRVVPTAGPISVVEGKPV